MIELTIEEKAKRYDEAINIANSKIRHDRDHILNEDDIIEIFPELKESIDESIKRALLEMVNDTKGDDLWINYNVHKEEAAAWLERQCKQSFNILWHDVNEEPEPQREIFCEWKSSTGVWHSVVFYHTYSKSFCEGERIITNVLKWTYINEMLEVLKD